MRQDMAKVIVERPRYGSRDPSRKKGYRKQIQKSAVEELPNREPMLGRWHGRERMLNEHLGPMRRFLRSRVGRLWNKVHQELCAHVSFDNAVQMHVLTHVFDYVERIVDVDGRRVFSAGGWRRGYLLPAGHLYVCPTTGLLKAVRPTRPSGQPQRIQSGPLLQFHFRHNAWWEVRLRKLPCEPGELWDVWLERDVSRLSLNECIAAYGGKLFATSKRPLKPAETRRLKRRLKSRRSHG